MVIIRGTLVLNDGSEYKAKFHADSSTGKYNGKWGDLCSVSIKEKGKWIELPPGKKMPKFFKKDYNKVYPFKGKNLKGAPPCDLEIIQNEKRRNVKRVKCEPLQLVTQDHRMMLLEIFEKRNQTLTIDYLINTLMNNFSEIFSSRIIRTCFNEGLIYIDAMRELGKKIFIGLTEYGEDIWEDI